MNSDKTAPRILGMFFILAFVAYALGNGLVDSVVNSTEGLSAVYANKGQVIFGAVLISVVHTFINLAVAAIMLSLLKPYSRILAYGYFGAAITATVMLVIGAIFLFLLIPLSDEFTKAGTTNTSYLQTLNVFCAKGNFFSYQIGMAIWGLGGLMLCSLLSISKLVPHPLAVWGFIGYIIFIAGTIAELFGHRIGVLLSIPGGLFEISLSIWLIGKGFNASPSN